MLNLELFHYSATLFLLWRLKEDFEATENVKLLKLEGTEVNCKLAFVSKVNPLQNIFGKIKESYKVRQ